jgi:ABC-2 type transport system ATP-binding protein
MLSTHSMPSVEELCDHIALINNAKVMLHGAVRDIRKQYGSRIYRIDFNGTRMALADAIGFTGELVELQEGGEHSMARIRLAKDASTNTLLRQLVSGVEVHGVQEEVPRMHDIFIRVVSEQEPTTVTAGMTE